jgi:hypothetical protein
VATAAAPGGHTRRDSLMALGKSKSMELTRDNSAGSGTAAPPVPLPKIRRSNSHLTHLEALASTNSPVASPQQPQAQPRRESPPNNAAARTRHHTRSRSSIVVRAVDEEFASSPVMFSRGRIDSEDWEVNDERLVLDEMRLRSEGVERTSNEFGSARRTSHARSNSTVGTTGRASGASNSSAATPSRHSRTGSSVTALSLDT